MRRKSRPPLRVVGGCYVLSQKLGQGSFGKVYVAQHVETGEEVAVKLEKLGQGCNMLATEARILRRLHGLNGIVGVHYSSVEGGFTTMVTDLLGPSLENAFAMCSKSFPLKMLLLLGQQMLRRLEDLHAVGIIHRDVKPENFALGRGAHGNVVYLIDFGLAKQYYCHKAEKHIPFTEHKGLTGTAQYASINAQLGMEQSRRDDIQALGYTLMYFLRGNLPWQTLESGPKHVVLRQILEMKQSLSAETLCEGHPLIFVEFLRYSSRLRFMDKPDYAFLRRVLKSPFDSQGFDGRMDFSDSEYGLEVPALPDTPDHGPEDQTDAAGSEIPVSTTASDEVVKKTTRGRVIVSL